MKIVEGGETDKNIILLHSIKLQLTESRAKSRLIELEFSFSLTELT